MLSDKCMENPRARIMTGIEAIMLEKARLFGENELASVFEVHIPEIANVVGALAPEIRFFNSNLPVFLDADTGLGKSSWVIGPLLDRIVAEKGRLLVVFNRISLGTQYKYLCIRKINPFLKKLYTPAGIADAESFPGIPIVFCTYQGLPGLIRRYEEGEIAHFNYVVADEVHWAVSDSLFAGCTWDTLKAIPQSFQESVRIYMTATPTAVRNLVAKAELEAGLPLLDQIKATYGGELYPPRKIIYYQFPKVDRNLNLFFLPSKVRSYPWKELPEIIEKSPKE